MPVNTSLTLTTLIADLRNDLMDTDPATYRWTDAILTRAIDRSVDRYSTVAPRFETSAIASVANTREYPSPSGCWYVDRVEYPVGNYPHTYRLFAEDPEAGTFEIDLLSGELPDGSQTIEVRAAFKHELDASGTTVPERHWDAIYLGAQVFAILAYLTTTNDNFDFVDGTYRDRIDDSGAADSWRSQYYELNQTYEARLKVIAQEGNDSLTPTILRWGDKLRWWDRL